MTYLRRLESRRHDRYKNYNYCRRRRQMFYYRFALHCLPVLERRIEVGPKKNSPIVNIHSKITFSICYTTRRLCVFRQTYTQATPKVFFLRCLFLSNVAVAPCRWNTNGGGGNVTTRSKISVIISILKSKFLFFTHRTPRMKQYYSYATVLCCE